MEQTTLTRTELLDRLHDAVSQMDDSALAALVDRLEQPNPRIFTEEQKAAFAKAVFDNDYSEMNRLKSEGRWIREQARKLEA